MDKIAAPAGWRLLWLVAISATAALGCAPSAGTPTEQTAAQEPWFTDAAVDSDLDFVNDPGPTGSYFMPQSMGNGAALLDYDQDGLLDIYLLNGAGADSKSTNRLYHQERGGKFRDVTSGSGLDVAGFGSGVTVGDVNNDGWPDVAVSEYGGLRLFVNSSGKRFQEVTQTSGLSNLWWGTSCGFLDFDRDGWLDLVVANYVELDASHLCYANDGRRDFCGPKEFTGSPALLFRNVTASSDPPQTKFENVTDASGLGLVAGPGLGVLCADFDGDGWGDIFVANDQQANRLWINRHDGTFQDQAVLRGVAVNGQGAVAANMGTAWGDVDGDGLEDLFVTHLDLENHTLWKQSPRGLFLDRTAQARLTPAPRTTGFGTVLADFDLDGDLDLAYVNGHVFRHAAAEGPAPAFWRPYAQRNSLWENDGSGRFSSLAASAEPLCQQPHVSRALCCGDLDNDGDLDLLAAPTAGHVQLWRNVAPRRGHWLLVRAIDPAVSRDAYGAVVTVTAGTRKWQRLINPASSYLSSNDPRVHFGLGDAAQIDSISVRWPTGETELFPGGEVDRPVEVRRSGGVSP
jgi:hypothetical protein